MRRAGDRIFVPHNVFVIVEQIRDAAPPSEEVINQEGREIEDRGDGREGGHGAKHARDTIRVWTDAGAANASLIGAHLLYVVGDEGGGQDACHYRDIELAAEADAECNSHED